MSSSHPPGCQSQQVRDATVEDAAAISDLVQAGFLMHIAPDWEPQARESFLRDTGAEQLASRISEASICLVSEAQGRPVGVLVMPRPTLVQLFFVDPGSLRQGIGRALWSAARARLAQDHPEVATVELNSSPYALAAYGALGFFPISTRFTRNGAVATRMACWLPGQALERQTRSADSP